MQVVSQYLLATIHKRCKQHPTVRVTHSDDQPTKAKLVSVFGATLKLVGLSQPEAAAYLKVSRDTARSWACGRSKVPPKAWDKLRKLYERQQSAADEALELIDETVEAQMALPSEVDFRQGERAKGWPSKGSYEAVAAQVVMESGINPGSSSLN